MSGREQKPELMWPSKDHDTDPEGEQTIGEPGVSKGGEPEHPTVRIQVPPTARIPASSVVPRQPQPPSQAPIQAPPPPQSPPQHQPPQDRRPQHQPPQEQSPDQNQPKDPDQSLLQPDSEPVPEVPEPETEKVEALRPRRSRRGLLITAFALVLAVAVGVTVALPDVSNRLALPWAPNAPQGPPPEPLAIARDLHGPAVSVTPPTSSGVAAALDAPASDPALGNLAGSVIDPATETMLWERDGSRAHTPASTTKLLTAGAALLALDPDTQLSTSVVQGEQPGTVILVAGGDVTLSSLAPGQESVYPGAASLDTLVEQVREATGGDVQQVRLDLSTFTGDSTAPGWTAEYVPSTFAAPVVPAMLDGGRSIATDPLSKRVDDPAGVLAREFAERLGAEVGAPLETPAPEGARVVGEVQSAPLTELINQMLLTSDNVLSEALARQVALTEGAEPSFEGAARATLDVLSRNGFETSGITLFDGSGLSTMNEVPANVLAELLSVTAAPNGDDPRAKALRPLLEGLPVAAGSGTLAERYTTGSARAGQGWVRAKTGTLDGVHTLAGVVLDSEDRVLVFALMSSGGEAESAREALDRIAAALRGCGC